jgi:hypothetical protein
MHGSFHLRVVNFASGCAGFRMAPSGVQAPLTAIEWIPFVVYEKHWPLLHLVHREHQVAVNREVDEGGSYGSLCASKQSTLCHPP